MDRAEAPFVFFVVPAVLVPLVLGLGVAGAWATFDAFAAETPPAYTIPFAPLVVAN